jgi:MtN3 and saliva related transmembrane protein
LKKSLLFRGFFYPNMDIFVMIGSVAAVLTTSAFLPQAVKVIQTKHTKDLSLLMYIALFIGTICWLTYGNGLQSFPLVAANSISLFFVSIILIMKLRYK